MPKATARVKLCGFCRQHGLYVNSIQHVCPFAECACSKCKLVRRRRQIMSRLSQTTRRLLATRQFNFGRVQRIATQLSETNNLPASEPTTNETAANAILPFTEEDEKQAIHALLSGVATAAEAETKTPRIYCWIATWSGRVDRALAVNKTWAKHCDKTVYVTPPECLDLPALDTGATDGRNGLWNKTRRAFTAIYETELENFDFFMKADDDVFVQVPRLRSMLAAHSADEATYFGCRFKLYAEQSYMSGGAGYVISREALRRFGESMNETKNCGPGNQPEDLQMGLCLEDLDVKAVDTRDEQTEKPEALISVHYAGIVDLYRMYHEFY
ncbi:N-acetylgalactosaminide beta-1,3-galactosyltransferase [Aphelenchoides fujianensis]|nr:N-acetylgalactosaminide beta-1,3-galactosyltransferase [Aphelenchoides fujianensis]